MQFSGFIVSPASAEVGLLVRQDGKIKHRFIAYFLDNTSAKNNKNHNWFKYLEVRQSYSKSHV